MTWATLILAGKIVGYIDLAGALYLLGKGWAPLPALFCVLTWPFQLLINRIIGQ